MAFVPPARHLLRARDLADARYAQPLDVDDMAGAAGLSRAHFSREFRRTFGESPHVYPGVTGFPREGPLLVRCFHASASGPGYRPRPANRGLAQAIDLRTPRHRPSTRETRTTPAPSPNTRRASEQLTQAPSPHRDRLDWVAKE
jgi:AraC-like DNA-binding protein